MGYSIHINIEEKLKEFGIFYERQKGRYESLKEQRLNIEGEKSFTEIYYNCSPNAFIKVELLAKVICLSKNSLAFLQFAAKPSNIFTSKDSHNSVFTEDIVKFNKDIVLLNNLLSACNRSYSERIADSNVIEDQYDIFKKPIVKTYFQWIAFLYYYNSSKLGFIYFSTKLFKIANSKLVKVIDVLYNQIGTKFKKFYTDQLAKNENKFVESSILDAYVKETLLVEIGIDIQSCIFPMTEQSLELHTRLQFSKDNFDYEDSNVKPTKKTSNPKQNLDDEFDSDEEDFDTDEDI